MCIISGIVLGVKFQMAMKIITEMVLVRSRYHKWLSPPVGAPDIISWTTSFPGLSGRKEEFVRHSSKSSCYCRDSMLVCVDIMFST